MKELVYMIALVVMAMSNQKVNIEEIVNSPSIQQEEKVELGDFFAFYDGTMFYYKEYAECVKKDKNYLSDYSKSKIKAENNYSEDFADGFSEYFRNYKSFKKKYKNRFEYLNKLIKEEY